MDGFFFFFNGRGAELTSLLGCICQEFARARDYPSAVWGSPHMDLARRDVIGGLVARFAHV